MRQIITVSLVSLAMGCFAQSDQQEILTGTKVSVEWVNKNAPENEAARKSNDKKKKIPSIMTYHFAFDPVAKYELSISIRNNTMMDLDYVVDVLFLKRNKFDRRYIPYECQQLYTLSVPKGQVKNISVASDDQNHLRPKRDSDNFAGHAGEAALEGWIVRVMRDGQVVKLVASSLAMERLAADPYVISCLESGQSIPVK